MSTALDMTQSHKQGPLGELATPAKILVVDDDELELSLMSDRLKVAGYQVVTAQDGAAALHLLDEQWFPIVLCDWQMPVMNGIQLIERLRERGGDDSYFIMLSVRASREDFERGYAAGVDDYLSKKSPDPELMARIRAGLHTVELRRSLRQTRATLLSSKMASEGSNPRAQLLSRLQLEIARARRYRRPCSLLMLGLQIEPAPKVVHEWRATPELRAALLQAVRGVIRVDIDWADADDFDLDGDPKRSLGFAIVLPETGPAEAIIVRTRIRGALLQSMRELIGAEAQLKLNVGAASIDPTIDNPQLTPEAMLASAGRCRRCMSDRGASRLHAVQASVANKVSIPCRQGYAVADHCLELKNAASESD
ncbi:MAG TPA: response regulator [Steroidobacteraceae bacterium]|nr:response regulator [Steroidobacteraceae bacterium]